MEEIIRKSFEQSIAVKRDGVMLGSSGDSLFTVEYKNLATPGICFLDNPRSFGGLLEVRGLALAPGGDLYALDAADGMVRWSFKTGGPVEGSPRVAGGVVYVGSSDGVLYAVETDRGLLRWKYRTGGSIRGAPAVKGRYLYVGSGDGALHAVDVTTGEVVWKAKTGGPVAAAPVVGDGLVFVGSKDGNLYAFRLPEEEPSGGDAPGGAGAPVEGGAAPGKRPRETVGHRPASERSEDG